MKSTLQITLVVLICVTIQLSNAEIAVERLKEFSVFARKACLAKKEVDTAILDDLQKGIFDEDHPDLKCYTKCIVVKLQLVKKGRYDTDKAIANMKKVAPLEMIPDLTAIFEKCRGCGDNIEDLCEMSWICTKCIYNANPQDFFFP